MLEIPHKTILNREAPIAVAKEHLANQIALLQDLANYGSNLVIRAFESSPQKMAEIVVCGVLLKQVVSMIDAAEVLLSAGCGHAAFLPARTAFEASVYLDWILESESEKRATRYIVGNYRDERMWSSRVIPGTPEEPAFTKLTIGADLNAKQPNLAQEAAEQLAEVNRILAQPELAAIDTEFSLAKGKKKNDPEWYQLDGPKSIRQLADKVGRLPEYEFFYSKGSRVSHTGAYKDHIRFSNNEVQFKPIRHLADVNMLLNYLVTIVMGTYKKVLTRYRPGEVTALMKKYMEDWRDPFINTISINYKF